MKDDKRQDANKGFAENGATELTDDKLDQVAGGFIGVVGPSDQTVTGLQLRYANGKDLGTDSI